MYELDGIFNRHDMPGIGVVDLIDDPGQCRRLTGTRGTCDENQSLAQVTE